LSAPTSGEALANERIRLEEEAAQEAERREGEQIARAQEAQRILENPLMVEAKVTLEETFMMAFRNSPPSDADGREELHRTLRLLDLFWQQLTTVLETGTLAARAVRDRAEQEMAESAEKDREPREQTRRPQPQE